MSGSGRSRLWRGVLVLGAGLLLVSAFVATPTFLHSRAATIPFGSDAFAQQWNSVEPKSPNFWGPADQPALQEAYAEATGGERLVQYFDKARMEQTVTGGAVTNGLLTVELITGQRQFGDSTFTTATPSSLPVVGDPSNAWPTYAALGGNLFAARSKQSGEPTGTVYKPDGTLGVDAKLAADRGAAVGSYQSDPGGKYAHNVPAAFSAFLIALPLPWQTAMGFPLTEAFWVNVRLNASPTWVMVQPYERRVLSYTPTNPAGFQVEMGNIGQHYYQWRYGSVSGSTDSAATRTPTTASGTTTATANTTSATASATADTATKTPKPATATATPSPTATPKPPTATPTATSSPTPVPKNVRISLTHVTVAAGSPFKLGPQYLSVETATVDITMNYDGSSNGATSTMHLTSWTRDNTNATVTSTDQNAPLTLADKQANIVLTATATIPFADPSTPSLVVTYTRKIAPSEYVAGAALASAPLSNAKALGYSVIITFAVSLG